MIKPILFNTDMVRAIMDGRKTVTRRVVHNGKSYPQYHRKDKFYRVVDHLNNDDKNWYAGFYNDNDVFTDSDGNEQIDAIYFKAPYKPGDILYVRETWQYLYELDGNEQIVEGTGKYYYAATDTLPFDTYVDSAGVTHEGVPWRPSIHMPKEAARIWLKVKNVRVERLQEIDDEGVISEGLEIGAPFDELWDFTIKKSDLDRYGWEANPWVWVIEFERCEKPEEE